jgi:hypothetical protein
MTSGSSGPAFYILHALRRGGVAKPTFGVRERARTIPRRGQDVRNRPNATSAGLRAHMRWIRHVMLLPLGRRPEEERAGSRAGHASKRARRIGSLAEDDRAEIIVGSGKRSSNRVIDALLRFVPEL